VSSRSHRFGLASKFEPRQELVYLQMATGDGIGQFDECKWSITLNQNLKQLVFVRFLVGSAMPTVFLPSSCRTATTCAANQSSFGRDRRRFIKGMIEAQRKNKAGDTSGMCRKSSMDLPSYFQSHSLGAVESISTSNYLEQKNKKRPSTLPSLFLVLVIRLANLAAAGRSRLQRYGSIRTEFL